MGKGGDTSAPPDALLAEALLADAAPAAAPCSGDGSALSRPPSRLSNWRDALASAPKRKVGEELPGVASVASVASLGTPSGGGPAPPRAVRARAAAPLPAALRADAALRDACRLDQGAQASDDDICAPELWGEAAVGGPAAAAATAAGFLPALPLLHAATADGQPLDDALWGVATQPRAAPEPEELAMLLGPDAEGAEEEGACLDGGGDGGAEADVPHGALTVPLLRHQRRALAWMSAREAGGAPVGGLLADDQGLGKTLTTISLIVSRRPPPRPAVRMSALPAGAAVAAGTLVVCPTSVLRQWARELRSRVSSAAALSVLLYHGPGRSRSAAEVARYDVVLTTYAIVTQELAAVVGSDKAAAKASSGGLGVDDTSAAASSPASAAAPAAGGVLGALTWWRVVLDEAQSIKNARSQVAAAVWALRARRRWCLSGTPLQNSVDDLYSYFRFLRYAPYDGLAAFRARVREPIRAAPQRGFAQLQRVLARVMLRRTKATRVGGEPIVRLPPRTVALRGVEFSQRERACYARLQAEYRAKFAEFRAAGTVSTNYVNILYMLLRLRQACNHLGLAALGGGSGGASARGAPPSAPELAAARRLNERRRAALLLAAEASRAECPLCADLPEEPVVAPCGAVFCRACWAQHAAADKAGGSGDDDACKSGGSSQASEDGREPCPACCAPHNEAFSVAALRAVAPRGVAAAVQQAPQVAQEALWAAEEAEEAAAAAGAEASCKLRAVLAYLRELRAAAGGVAPLRGAAAAKRAAAAGAAAGAAQQRRDRSGATRDTGEQLRAGIKSSDAALAAALPPLPPVAFSGLRAAGGGAAPGLAGPPDKVIIFSQWTGMLNLLEPALRADGFAFRRLDGTMSLAAREKALHEFETRPDVRVMLMSLKAAGLGVNLVCANHVLLLDVWWNPTVEEQAIDRSHRIGQTREVHVARFTVRGTVEDRILALQEHKRALAAAAFGEAEGGDASRAATAAGAGAERSKLTVEDLLFLFEEAPPAAAEEAAANVVIELD